MSVTTENTAAQIDYLAMSDEEIMNAVAPVEPAAVVEETNEGQAPEAAVTEAATEVAEQGNGEEESNTGASDTATETKTEATEEKAEAEKQEEKAEKETQAVDYEAEYKRLLAPFKANGREIQVKSVDDAVALMQMGANYNKRMAALKPNLKMLKLLENNGLLNEEKLSYLIDLEKKNPAAINKLVKDSGLDPMDLDAEKAGEYKPKIHSVDDREIDLDTVLDEIQETPTYTQTLEIVSKKWDGASKQTIASTPQLLKVINDHVANGIYDLINQEVERERMFGRLNGLSDIEAYRRVGDAINARGGFNHLVSNQGKPNQEPVVVQPKAKAPADDKLNEKRRAASSTKPANVSTAAASDFNPLALSDEEFSKLAEIRFR